MLDFIFDVYEMDVGCKHLVGKLIFPNELEPLNSFMQAFDGFIQIVRQKDPSLDNLHKAHLPEEVREKAEKLYKALALSGLPSD